VLYFFVMQADHESPKPDAVSLRDDSNDEVDELDDWT
jgi:hypothetical protein